MIWSLNLWAHRLFSEDQKMSIRICSKTSSPSSGGCFRNSLVSRHDSLHFGRSWGGTEQNRTEKMNSSPLKSPTIGDQVNNAVGKADILNSQFWTHKSSLKKLPSQTSTTHPISPWYRGHPLRRTRSEKAPRETRPKQSMRPRHASSPGPQRTGHLHSSCAHWNL